MPGPDGEGVLVDLAKKPGADHLFAYTHTTNLLLSALASTRDFRRPSLTCSRDSDVRVFFRCARRRLLLPRVGDREVTDAIDVSLELVARLHRPHPRRRAGHDEVAGF